MKGFKVLGSILHWNKPHNFCSSRRESSLPPTSFAATKISLCGSKHFICISDVFIILYLDTKF